MFKNTRDNHQGSERCNSWRPCTRRPQSDWSAMGLFVSVCVVILVIVPYKGFAEATVYKGNASFDVWNPRIHHGTEGGSFKYNRDSSRKVTLDAAEGRKSRWTRSVGTSGNDLLLEGQAVVQEFFQRYNSSRQVDLVFVLDHSRSVPRRGWHAMLNFVRDLLEHFTVDEDNTRVAVVTFSTTASVDINDLRPGSSSDRENKCTLHHRISDYLENRVPYGYTATHAALRKAYQVLLHSRPTAKKAVFVLTDGRSNIGPPPVKAAIDLRALRWDQAWSTETLGPQLEIYAIGIEQAELAELESIASSSLPRHVLLIPDFRSFDQLARSLHGDKQEENWIPTSQAVCGLHCNGARAHCMCGTKVGQYACVCEPGFEKKDDTCIACPKGFYKEHVSPEPCQPCPANTTTEDIAATSLEYCELLPEFRVCPELEDIPHGSKFYVPGMRRDELNVLPTNRSCSRVSAGNSCHYTCDQGYRLTGPPYMLCNFSSQWVGNIPACEVVDCERAGKDLVGGSVLYINDSTTYGSSAVVECDPGHHPTDATLWTCTRYGLWTHASNFQCLAVWCNPFAVEPYASMVPDACNREKLPLGTVCNMTCAAGFEVTGPTSQECTFTKRALWWPRPKPECVDVEVPVITCPADLTVQVAHWNENFTVIHLGHEAPHITDNSGMFHFRVLGVPPEDRFPVGHTVLVYEAKDAGNNLASCRRTIHVKSRQVALLHCPGNITAQANSIERSRTVNFGMPVFVDVDNASLPVTCTHPSPSEFRDVTRVSCHPEGIATVTCEFYIIVTDPDCTIPYINLQPMHGSLICGKSLPHYPRACRIHCKQGYELRRHSDDHKYTCGWNGEWDIVKPWPACSRTRRPPTATSDNEVILSYEGPCEQSKEDIAEAFIKSMTFILKSQHDTCRSHENSCAVTNVQVFCNSRSKRHAISGRDWQSAPFKSEEYPYYSNHRNQRHLLQTGDLVLENTFNNGTVRIEFEIMGTIMIPSENITKDNQTNLSYDLDDIFYRLKDETDLYHNWTFSIGNKTAHVRVLTSITYPHFPINCSQGEEEHIGQNDLHAACVTCPEGMFKPLEGIECQECPLNTYQDQTGQSECTPCPVGAITMFNGSTTQKQCIDQCQEGSFSETGYEPCRSCQTGTYQPSGGATACLSCPSGTSTGEPGAEHVDNCTALCEAGEWSLSGVVPCEPCPLHTYRPVDASSISCLHCPPGMHTLIVGATKQDQCLEVNDCSETSLDVCNGRGQCHNGPFSAVNSTKVENTNSSLENATTLCSGNGSCEATTGWVSCDCDLGYAGRYCEVNVDNCIGVVCFHGGSCVDLLNSYMCNCADGYTGVTCEVEVDECQSSPCLNDGFCEDKRNGFMCHCRTGFHGVTCEEDENDCLSQPCLHGNCTDGPGNYTCVCVDGYAGAHCDIELDECDFQPCQNDGLCEDAFNGFKCYCPAGFKGDRCEIDDDECASSPCVHGLCKDGVAEYSCQCEAGYTGLNCEVAVEHCTDSPCVHGECRNSGDTYMCDCILGYTGVHCEVPVDWCADHACLNGATCMPLYNSSSCKCQPPHTGSHCQTVAPTDFDLVFSRGDVEDFAMLRTLPDLTAFTVCAWLRSTDALHYGTLLSYAVDNNWLGADPSNALTLYDIGFLQVHVNAEVAQTRISLNSGHWEHLCVTWTSEGGHWQVFVNGSRSANGHDLARGTTILGGGYLVIGQEQDLIGGGFNWRESFVGQVTGLNIYSHTLDDETIASLSENCTSRLTLLGDILAWTDVAGAIHGSLILREGSWCPDLDECLYPELYPCPEHKQCVDTFGNYTCESCESGWMGPQCDTVINECSSQPCLHGATCIDGPELGDYYCTCEPGYTGHMCEVKLDPCFTQPCKNEGICEAWSGDVYTCACMPQFTGIHCEELLSGATCEDSPCLNGGSCMPTEDGVSCECRPGIGGQFCERYLNVCAKQPCYHGGTCVSEGPDRFRCDCPPDWRGELCQVSYHVTCDTSPCLNNGTCRDTEVGYECQCIPLPDPHMKYGDNCEVVTACSSHPCLHAGTCVYFGGANYTCHCMPGFLGTHCEVVVTTVPTTVSTQGLPDKDYCINVDCRNGGKCVNKMDGFKCDCQPGYTGIYCAIKRETELRKYHVVVTLMMEYSSRLQYDIIFKRNFSDAIHRIYWDKTKESIISVDINSIKSGSTIVDFNLEHTVYQDASAPGHEAMKQILQQSLLKGTLGSFPASMDNFVFEFIGGSGGGGVPLWLAILIAFILLALLLVGLAIWIGVRFCRQRRPLSKLNNIPDRLQNEITNPAYLPGSDMSDITSLRLSGAAEENLYDELGPYAVTTKWDLQNEKNLDLESNIGASYPSKFGREINKDWDSGYMYKPNSEASEYLDPRKATLEESPSLPPRLAPPPPYRQVDEIPNLTFNKTPSDAYLTPVSHHEKELVVEEASEEEFEEIDETGMSTVVPPSAYEMNKYVGKTEKLNDDSLSDTTPKKTLQTNDSATEIEMEGVKMETNSLKNEADRCDIEKEKDASKTYDNNVASVECGQINMAYQSSDDSLTTQEGQSVSSPVNEKGKELQCNTNNEIPGIVDDAQNANEVGDPSELKQCLDESCATSSKCEEAVEVEYAIRSAADKSPGNVLPSMAGTEETKIAKADKNGVNTEEEEEDYLALLPATDVEKKAAATIPATLPKAKAKHKQQRTGPKTGQGEARPKSMPSLVSPDNASATTTPSTSSSQATPKFHIGPKKAASMASISKPSHWWSRPSLGATSSSADVTKPSRWWSRPSLGVAGATKSDCDIVPDMDPRRRKLPSLPKFGGRR